MPKYRTPEQKRNRKIGLGLLVATVVAIVILAVNPHNAVPATAVPRSVAHYRIVSVVSAPARPGELAWRITVGNPTSSVVYAQPAWNYYAADGEGRPLAGTNGIYGWPTNRLRLLPHHRVGYTFMIGAPSDDLSVLHPAAKQYCVVTGARTTMLNGPRSCVLL